MISRSMYVIAVQNLQDSAIYYRDVLGFSLREIGDDGWRMLERGACSIMAGNCPDAMRAEDTGDHAYFAYLVVDNASREYSQVIAKDAEITKLLRDEPWGMREFGVKTIDGHRIMFGQDID